MLLLRLSLIKSNFPAFLAVIQMQETLDDCIRIRDESETCEMIALESRKIKNEDLNVSLKRNEYQNVSLKRNEFVMREPIKQNAQTRNRRRMYEIRTHYVYRCIISIKTKHISHCNQTNQNQNYTQVNNSNIAILIKRVQIQHTKSGCSLQTRAITDHYYSYCNQKTEIN